MFHKGANENGFNVIWRCFSRSNRTLAMIALRVAAAYLVREGKYRFGSLITALPAAFMSAVSMTCILTADEGLHLSTELAYPIDLGFAAALLIVYAVLRIRRQRRK